MDVSKKENKSSGSYFPILIDLKRFTTLVIGGGEIATRKVRNLLEFDADITVIAGSVCDELKTLANDNPIELIQRNFQKGDTEKFDMVFCATGDEITDKIVFEECQERRILLNVADVPELCNFIMPATLKRGMLTISVASQGKAPFFVKETKRNLASIFPENVSQIVDLAALLRDKMIDNKLYYDKEKREKTLKEFLSIDIDKMISEEGMDKAGRLINELSEKYK